MTTGYTTTNKGIVVPTTGATAWDGPLDANWNSIDNAFGGISEVSVTGVTTSPQYLTAAQYQAPFIHFSGTLGLNLTYYIPSGVGGFWFLYNTCGGTSYTLTFSGSANGIVLALSTVALVVVSAVSGDLFYDEQYANIVQANAQGYANTAQSNAETYASNASHLSSGTVANARLNNVGVGPGVSIQPISAYPPGGTLVAGQLFFYY